MPGRSAPTSPASPTAAAPPSVAARIASGASGVSRPGSPIAASPQKSFIDWNMFCTSEQAQLSQPSAISTPASR